MSTDQNQATNQTTDVNVNKSRVITCFIYYNDDDDLPKIFEVACPNLFSVIKI